MRNLKTTLGSPGRYWLVWAAASAMAVMDCAAYKTGSQWLHTGAVALTFTTIVALSVWLWRQQKKNTRQEDEIKRQGQEIARNRREIDGLRVMLENAFAYASSPRRNGNGSYDGAAVSSPGFGPPVRQTPEGDWVVVTEGP